MKYDIGFSDTSTNLIDDVVISKKSQEKKTQWDVNSLEA